VKKTIAFVALSLTFAATASFAAGPDTKDVAKKAHCSQACAAKIMKEAVIACNSDSKKSEGSDREHQCLYSPQLSTMSKGVLNIVFTVGDSDEWGYNVQISDEADANDCDFKIKPDGQNG
jgi:hypothetical protein